MGSCRCKMCGGHIHYDDNLSVSTCEFCGTEQTIVKTDDTKRVNLFNRANALRRQNEFDKAQLTYDNILIDEPNNAEAHWGICLCRYGIEYVTLNDKKVPTCHRTAITSIFDDLDYKETINNADVVAKKVYEAEASKIDKLQKEILAISQKEEPYDIFISYKEHDEANARTKDSIKAENVYKKLEEKGYRVFYSRVTLKGIDVSKYEPIIFAALMSSKVMLSIGSKKDYYYAIWEKNEWSRFMTLMKDDRKKVLIPCYFDMDYKELPEEFMMLQSIDINDDNIDNLINRIDKLFTTSEKVVVTKEQVEVREQVVNKMNVENNIGRIGLFLIDGKFSKAKELIENVLNIDFKCAEAYYYRMLASYNCKNEDELVNKMVLLDNDKDAEKVLKFGDLELRNKIDKINEQVKEKIKEKEKNELIVKISNLIKNKKYKEALDSIYTLGEYNNTSEDIYKFKKEIYDIAEKKTSEKSYDEAISIFSMLNDFNNANARIGEINHLIKIDEENKKCDKLCESIETIFRLMYTSKEYDAKAINRIKEKMEGLREFDLCPYAMDRYNSFKERYKALEEKREKDKKVNRIVAFIALGVGIAIAIAAFIYIFTRK